MKKILLISDDDVERERIAEMLELANYEVVVSKNGRDGILLAIEENPDLIVCDLTLPELDGHGVLQIMGRNPKTAGIPFIFVGAKAGKAETRKVMDMGADDFLTKPLEGTELLSSVQARLKKNEHVESKIEWSITGVTKLLDGIKDKERLLQLTGGKKPRLFRKREIIFLEGDPAESIVFISSGKIKTYKTTHDGKELITGIHKAGDFVGTINFIENKNYIVSAAALEDCEVLNITKQAFHSLIYADRDLSVRFINLLSNDISEMEERMLNLAYNSARKRIANGLLLIQKQYTVDAKKPGAFSIMRDDLAALVGISPESVSRTLQDFVRESLIKLEEKHVVILNQEKLKSMKN